jgi:hypothetical protein
METNLRPLTLGEILDRTAQLYRSHFWLFAGIASVYSGTILLLNLVQIGVLEILRVEHLTRFVMLANAVGAVFQLFVIFAVGGLAVAANNRAVGWVHLGEPASIRGAYAGILPRTGRFLWLMTIIWFVLWTPMALAYGGYILAVYRWVGPNALKNLTAGAASPNPQTALAFGLVTLCFCLVAALALAWAIVMGMRYALAIAASVVEDLRARQAIRRSIDLGKGARGRIFVLGLLVAVIQIGLVLITQLFFIVLSIRQHGEMSAGARVAQQLVAFVTNTFIGPIYATGLTLFYYDQRVRKEGYDIEWMMQAAGLTPQPAQLTPPVALAAPAADMPGDVPAPHDEPDREPDHAEPA